MSLFKDLVKRRIEEIKNFDPNTQRLIVIPGKHYGIQALLNRLGEEVVQSNVAIIPPPHVCDDSCFKAKQLESERSEGRHKLRDTKKLLNKTIIKNRRKTERTNRKRGRQRVH